MSRRSAHLAHLALLCACNERTLPDPAASAGPASTSTGIDEHAASTTTAGASTAEASTGSPTTGAPPAPSTCGDGHVDVGEVCLGEPVLIDATPVERLWTADVDADGRTDLLTEAGLWLQRDGGFEPGVLPALTASWRGFGDFDGDGRVDIFSYDTEAQTVALSLGDGAGGFAEPVVTEVTQLVGPDPVDVDGDGRTEIVANAYDLAALRTYAAGDDGHVAPIVTQPMSEWNSVRSVGDGEGDGFADRPVGRGRRRPARQRRWCARSRRRRG